jgi:hypothetical protein
MKNIKTFYWNPETLQFFKELKNENINEFYRKVNEFVKYECDLEEDEYIEDLQIDLINQIKRL